MISIDVNDLELSRDELAARMMCTDLTTLFNLIDPAVQEVKSNAECYYTFEKTGVKISGGSVRLGFGEVKSTALAKCLEGCDSAFIVAVTLGHPVDRLLRQKSVTSTTEQFVTDAVASALCEALCDKVQSLLPLKTRRRFSPGYGDLSLEVQFPLLNYLDNCGIVLTETGLMIPSKSVTFIAGVEK